MQTEIETWGVTYERYALGQELKRLKKRFAFESVAEMPAHGAKAMPSIYSIAFGLAGAKVILINGVETYRRCWEQLGLEKRVEFVTVDDINNTGIPAGSFDFVWDFAFLPITNDQNKLLEEMKRISQKYVAFFSVNYGNVGFHIHRTLHKIKNIPWTHGDMHYNKRGNVVRFLKHHGLKIVTKGFVDCPIWPDSLGFRDMRLHRENITFDSVDWESPYIDNLESKRFPLWIKLVYTWERIPNFSFLKTLYAHINYVVGEKCT